MAVPPVNFSAKEKKEMRVVMRGQVVGGLLAGRWFDGDDKETARKRIIDVSGNVVDALMAAEGIDP